MKAQVIVAPEALRDFREMASFLEREAGGRVAANYAGRLDDALTLIEEHPEIGSPRRRLGKGVRIWPIAPWVLFYETGGESVLILRLLHGKRRITPRLLRPEQ